MKNQMEFSFQGDTWDFESIKLRYKKIPEMHEKKLEIYFNEQGAFALDFTLSCEIYKERCDKLCKWLGL